MPRAPTVYSLPAGTTVVPGQTIESSWANALTADIEQTFNTAQPIVYGGTGATSAGAGADNLSPPFVDVASGTTTNIGAASSPNVSITGTTTITGFDSKTAGVKRFLKFAGILTLTHNATSLILPGGANITTAAGDAAIFVSEGSGNWRCLAYQKANGEAVVSPPADGYEDFGLGVLSAGSAITDFTTTDANFSRIFRAEGAATGGPGTAVAGIALPLYGTPGTVYLSLNQNNVIWVGYKNGATATPIWSKPLEALDATWITTGTLPIARGGTGQTTEAGMRGVYTGTNVNNVAYPIGSTVLVQGSVSTDRNASVPIYQVGTDRFMLSSGTALTGTWRARGYNSLGSGALFQRTA